MEEQQEEAESACVEHQYMCSECQQLFNTLEDVLVHQRIHTGQDADGEVEIVEGVTVQGVLDEGQTQTYQCLECGALIINPEELLQHQEMHMREAEMEVEQQGDDLFWVMWADTTCSCAGFWFSTNCFCL